MALRPESSGAHGALGTALSEGDADGAIAEYREAIRFKDMPRSTTTSAWS